MTVQERANMIVEKFLQADGQFANGKHAVIMRQCSLLELREEIVDAMIEQSTELEDIWIERCRQAKLNRRDPVKPSTN